MLTSWLLLGASLVWVSAAAQTVAIYDSAVVDSTPAPSWAAALIR